VIDQSNWEFEFRNPAGSSRKLTFQTALDLVHYLAGEQDDDFIRMQGRIANRIKDNPVARQWKSKRNFLKDLKHFPRYRGKHYDLYHNAARGRHHGTASAGQLSLVNGLEAEINGSNIIVPGGQILFHGRANLDLTSLQPYPSFVSTSLCPIVARQSAIRRAGVNRANGLPVVYVLTLRSPMPALWGQAGNSSEYELLLRPGLTCTGRGRKSGVNFDVIEADVM
jgi:hypothetical protein